MSVTQKLRALLDQNRVKYVVITHSPAFTAQEIAQSLHTPGREVAKAVVVRRGDKLALAVLPAQARVDVERLAEQIGAPVELVGEDQFAAAFPDSELGAMPPFGNLYGIETYVDDALTRDREIVFNAGSHTEAVRMSFDDYRRLVQPVILSFGRQPVTTGS